MACCHQTVSLKPLFQFLNIKKNNIMQKYGKYTEAEILDFLLGDSTEEMRTAILNDMANSTELSTQIKYLDNTLTYSLQNNKVRNTFKEARQYVRLQQIKKIGAIMAITALLGIGAWWFWGAPNRANLSKNEKLEVAEPNMIESLASNPPSPNMNDNALYNQIHEQFKNKEYLKTEKGYKDLASTVGTGDSINCAYLQVISAILSKRPIKADELIPFIKIVEMQILERPTTAADPYLARAILAAKQHDIEKTKLCLQKTIDNDIESLHTAAAQKTLHDLE